MIAALLAPSTVRAVEFYVAVQGSDQNAGTVDAPFATIERAQQAVRARPAGAPAAVLLGAGVYHLARPLEFGAADGGTPTAPVNYEAMQGAAVELSGAQALSLTWTQDTGGRWRAEVPAGLDFDQLFADGKKMIRARYPNFDPGEGFFGGLSDDATDPKRLASYADPVGMFVHGYQGLGWGSLDFEILQKSPDGHYQFEAGKDPRVAGGWQNKGRAGGTAGSVSPFSPDQRFVENVFEELDAPKEWYLDRKKSVLWFIPPAGANPRQMTFEGVTLKNLISVVGTSAAPVRNLTFSGFHFRRASYTFMQTRDIPSGGDWRIFRGGAVLFDGAVDCTVRDCVFDGVGGNAVFVRDYNRGVEITGCEFVRTGASAVLFDGDKAAVRSWWAHEWGWPKSEIGPRPQAPGDNDGSPRLGTLPAATLDAPAADRPLIDLEPGPKGVNYPSRCIVRDCLMHDLGTVEKQISGVFISKSRQIVVSHVTIHDIPRAAINFNDGLWGGHVVEWCDIFNTCLESREHGAINAWGRDRYWIRMSPKGAQAASEGSDLFARIRDFSRLDAVDVTVLRYNRVQCAGGYDIDLDDGSSNFEIYGNLCLQGGIKLREGFFRTVRNNISPLLSTHVWYPDSHDIVTQNIFVAPAAYSPRGMELGACKDAWFDYNLFAAYKPADKLRAAGLDRHSITADPQFVNPGSADYQVRDSSPAAAIGFVNIPMDRFGVSSPRLQSLTKAWSGLDHALTAATPAENGAPKGEGPQSYQWLGATLRNLTNFGAESPIVAGMELADNRGVLIKAVNPGTASALAGLRADAVIMSANGQSTANIATLISILEAAADGKAQLKVLTATGYIDVAIDFGGRLPKPARTNAKKPRKVKAP